MEAAEPLVLQVSPGSPALAAEAAPGHRHLPQELQDLSILAAAVAAVVVPGLEPAQVVPVS